MEDGTYQETDRERYATGWDIESNAREHANIYLHYVLDLWFEQEVKKQLRGFAQLVRYAEDFVVCLQYSSDAEAFGAALRERLAKFGLAISEEKSRIIAFGRSACQQARKEGKKCATFDFLGFTLYCDKDRNGNFKVGRKTASKKFRQKRSYNWCQFNQFLARNPLPKPKIYHFYALSKRRGCAPEEPDG